MKNRYSRCRIVPLLFVLATLGAPPIARSGTGAEYSRNELMGNSGLAVFRAADFGWQLGLAIYLDGVPLTTLSRGEGYHAIVRPGKHKLTVTNTPSPYGKTNWSHRTITLSPGQNYSFTAIWDAQYISIEDGGYVYHGFYR